MSTSAFAAYQEMGKIKEATPTKKDKKTNKANKSPKVGKAGEQPKIGGEPRKKIKKGKTRRNGKRIPKYEEDILIDQEMQLMQRAQREMANGDHTNGSAKQTGKSPKSKSPAKALKANNKAGKKAEKKSSSSPKKMLNKSKEVTSSSSEGSDGGDDDEVDSGDVSSDVEYLNGDDAPLVEAAMEEMLDSEGEEEDDDDDSGSGMSAEDFMDAVQRANNSSQNEDDEYNSSDYDEEETEEMVDQLKKAFGLNKDEKKNKKKRKAEETFMMESGMGLVPIEPAGKKSKKMKVSEAEEKKPKKGKKKNSDLGKHETGSVDLARERMSWMISPHKVDAFFSENWEKRPLHVKRGKPGYYTGIFSTKSFDAILREETVVYGKNLDVTSFTPEEGRQTHNPAGRAHAPVVWDFYNNGCSLRMLNPQTFDPRVWELCATLQELFGSMVGANMYLTPPGTQGFAPHFDDVEVFILQVEGKKRWRCYEPRNAQETLPRFSSPNFSQSEMGKPCIDTVLEAGDFLYLPRGTIHQGNCLPDAHSLHITVSAAQLNSFGDLLERVVPAALQTALAEDADFRKGLPVDFMSFMGVSHSDQPDSKKRKAFLATVERLMGKMFTYAPVDAGADQLGRRFMRDSLPAYLTEREKKRTVAAGGEKWSNKDKKVVNRVEIDPDTEIRLLRANCVRVCSEDANDEGNNADDDSTTEDGPTGVRLYYSVDNSREIHGSEEQFLDIGADAAEAVDFLLSRYPEFVKPEELPMEGLDEKMQVVQDLWERKLLMTREPLESHYDDLRAPDDMGAAPLDDMGAAPLDDKGAA